MAHDVPKVAGVVPFLTRFCSCLRYLYTSLNRKKIENA